MQAYQSIQVFIFIVSGAVVFTKFSTACETEFFGVFLPLSRTSYFFFTKQERQNVVQENPNVSVTEVAKILGEMWSKLDEKEKEKYKEMASKDKERYEEEMKAYKNGDHVLPPSKKITLDSEVEEWVIHKAKAAKKTKLY